LFTFVKPRYIALVTVVLLVGYWLAMSFVNVPGVGKGSYAEGHNLANYLDQHYLGGWKWDAFKGDETHPEDKEHRNGWDPEGYLSTFPAIATCLLGVFAGLLLRCDRMRPALKFLALFLGGAALAGIGYAWGFRPSPVHMPVIKKLWTSSYVLLAGGYSALILALFYLVIDIWRLRAWAAPFVWVGSNAILLYMVTELGIFHDVAARLVGGTGKGDYHWPFWGSAQHLVTSLVSLTFVLVLARFLYRRGVFIRV
jgi:predicted acyltransferase